MTISLSPEKMLSSIEARILGVLVEKEVTTPDVYPLTLNAIQTACNQKSSRNPVMDLSESEIFEVLQTLRTRSWVSESYGASGRVLRYAHNLPKMLKLSPPAVALLTVLMLRGPQTPGELRTHCDRLYRFSDLSSLEAYLDEMAARSEGALVVRLSRQPGSRESRYAHLLCGEPADFPEVGPVKIANGDAERQLADLCQEVEILRQQIAYLYSQLGIALPPES